MTDWKTLTIYSTSHKLWENYMSVESCVWLFSTILYLEQIENGRVVYTNTLRADTSSYGEITRQVHLKINVACQMDQDSVSQIMYLVEHTGNSSIVGTGKFNTSMNFYTSGSFYYQVCSGSKGTVQKNLLLNTRWHFEFTLSGDSSAIQGDAQPELVCPSGSEQAIEQSGHLPWHLRDITITPWLREQIVLPGP